MNAFLEVDPFICFKELFMAIKSNNLHYNWFTSVLSTHMKEITINRLTYMLSVEKVVREKKECLYQRKLRVRKILNTN